MKIVSGGQTGVDRAALDFAIQQDMSARRLVSIGRLAEDGIIPPQYQLHETDSPEYGERTEKNVVDSDATLIVYTRERFQAGRLSPTHWPSSTAGQCWWFAKRTDCGAAFPSFQNFFNEIWCRTLNVAGPRESQAAGLVKFVKELLETTFKQRKARSV